MELGLRCQDCSQYKKICTAGKVNSDCKVYKKHNKHDYCGNYNYRCVAFGSTRYTIKNCWKNIAGLK